MALVILTVVFLMCVWGESVLFGTDTKGLSSIEINIARFIHMYNVGTALTVIYVTLHLVSQAYKNDAQHLFNEFNIAGDAWIFLFLYIGVVTFVLNISFYRGLYHDRD